MTTDTLVFETNFLDFQFIVQRHLLEQLFPKVRYVYIERLDKIAQAVSLLRASKSKVWHIKEAGEKRSDENIEYSDWDVMRYYHALSSEDNQWKRFFLKRGIRPFMITYESFENGPRKVVADTYQYITGEHVELDEVKIGLRKGADERSAEMIAGVKAKLQG